MGEQMRDCGLVGELVDYEGRVGRTDVGQLCKFFVCRYAGLYAIYDVSVRVGDYVGIAWVVDGDDCESMTGDGGGNNTVIEAWNAPAWRQEKDWSMGLICTGTGVVCTNRQFGAEKQRREIDREVELLLEVWTLVFSGMVGHIRYICCRCT